MSTANYTNLDDKAAATATPMVSVTAPSALPEGYTLDAVVNGQTVKVAVPPGGVKEGQEFQAPIISDPDQHNTPHGMWRDGIFSCFNQGVCHPSLCLSFWCTPLSLAQVMTRLKLNWCGEQKGPVAASKTFLYIAIIFLAYIILDMVLDIVMLGYTPETAEGENAEDVELSEYSTTWWILYSVRVALRLAFFIYFLVVTIRTRQIVREKYSIPQQHCCGFEDCCCSYWCNCCTVAQMQRHTVDYDKYPAQCCTTTGLKADAPEIV